MSEEGTIGQELETILSRHAVPGCSIAAQWGDEFLSLQLGSADAAGTRPVKGDTVFHLFSGTKLFTAAALMLLRERGEVDLDAPVTEYLPALPLRFPITARQLASHSSGLSDSMAGFLAVHFYGEEAIETEAALTKYRTNRGGLPGRKAAYRNVNYAILGELIGKVSGVPFQEFVETELLRPLGIEAMFDYTEETRTRAAEGTIHRFSPMRWLLRIVMPEVAKRLERKRLGSVVTLNEFSLDTAAIGGLIGCAENFLPLASEFLSSIDGVLSAESKREMLTQQSKGRAGIASAEGVGIGWKRGCRAGVEFWNHEGGGPGFMSETRIYPDYGLGVVIMMNATHTAKLSWLAHEMCELLRSSSYRR